MLLGVLVYVVGTWLLAGRLSVLILRRPGEEGFRDLYRMFVLFAPSGVSLALVAAIWVETSPTCRKSWDRVWRRVGL